MILLCTPISFPIKSKNGSSNDNCKTASWNDKLDLEVLWCYIKYDRHPKEWFNLKHSPVSKEIHWIMITYWLYK